MRQENIITMQHHDAKHSEIGITQSETDGDSEWMSKHFVGIKQIIYTERINLNVCQILCNGPFSAYKNWSISFHSKTSGRLQNTLYLSQFN